MSTDNRPCVEISLTPFPQKVPAILECGYGFDMGKTTRIVVSAEDADFLEAMANRTVMNQRTHKIESRARFSVTRIKDMPPEAKAKEKLPNRRGVAEVPALQVPHEEANKMLQKNLEATQAVMSALPAILDKLTTQQQARK